MDAPTFPIAVWQESADAWSAGAYAFDVSFTDIGPGLEFDRTAFRWACSGFATEAAARAGYGVHHPHPGDYACTTGRDESVGGLQAAITACVHRFHLAGSVLLPLPTGAKCTWCQGPGTAYEYQGRAYDGLTAFRGERLCGACRDARMATEGVDILVRPDGPWREPYVVNTVADRDKVTLWLPPELRGVDGRDLRLQGRHRRRNGSARASTGRRGARPAAGEPG